MTKINFLRNILLDADSRIKRHALGQSDISLHHIRHRQAHASLSGDSAEGFIHAFADVEITGSVPPDRILSGSTHIMTHQNMIQLVDDHPCQFCPG